MQPEIDRTASEIGALCDRVEAIARDPAAAGDGVASEVTGTFARLRMLHRRLGEGRAALGASVEEQRRGTEQCARDLEAAQAEAAYIRREIASTETLETIYQDIDLEPEAAFRADAPEELLKGADDSPHALMLARLRFEVHQRDMLAAARDKARARRDELRLAKRRRSERLEKTDTLLHSYIKSAALVGRSLGVAVPGPEAKADRAED
ncbi:hypothetical protein GGF46_004075 [Coemansia sp. RSA 552]|nr:hypothetical protein GGF46_004075 [Coemansia sp. RSA 552]